MTPKQTAILDAAADALVAFAQVLRELKSTPSPYTPTEAPQEPAKAKAHQSPDLDQKAPEEPAPEAVAPSPEPEEKKTTLEDLQAVGLAFLEAGRRNDLKELLVSRGLKSLSSTPPELFDELIEAMHAAL